MERWIRGQGVGGRPTQELAGPTRVAVQVVLYNSLANLDKLLPALAMLRFDGLEVSLAFFDNSPGSGARDRVTRHELPFPVEFLDSGTANIGFGRAHNMLARRTFPDSNFRLLLNPDTIVFDDVLVRLVSSARQRPGAALVEAAQFPVEHQKAFDPITGHTDWCCATCLLVRSDAFQRLGGFDERLFLYCEDVDLSWRAWLAGYECVYVPEARCVHISQEDDIGKDRSAEIFHMELGNLYLRAKYFGRRAVADHIDYLRPRFGAEFLERLAAEFKRIDPGHAGRVKHPRIEIMPDHVNYAPVRWTP